MGGDPQVWEGKGQGPGKKRCVKQGTRKNLLGHRRKGGLDEPYYQRVVGKKLGIWRACFHGKGACGWWG